VSVSIRRSLGSAVVGSVLLIVFGVPILTVGCGGDNGTAQAADTATDTEATAEAIRATERERLQALVLGDVEAAAKFHADDFQLITPAGDALSKKQYLDGISAGKLDYASWEPTSPIEVRVYGEGAVIRYQSKIRLATGFGGSALPFWHTDVYEKRNGRWQVVWSQATGAG
jgi:ketosteroid isomerase-like protein